MDVVPACVLWLRTDPHVTRLVGKDADGAPLVVQDSAPERDEFPQQVCIVVQLAGFEGGNDHNTYQQARLLIEFWADPERDPDGFLEAPSAGRERMTAAYTAVDRRLHRPQGGEQYWGGPGGLRTTDCLRRTGLAPYLVPGSDGLWRGTAIYAAGLG